MQTAGFRDSFTEQTWDKLANVANGTGQLIKANSASLVPTIIGGVIGGVSEGVGGGMIG
ncbi:hypothetical protein QUF64_13710 [Anaerolineales bacterium HSG6]|nr:hypothetical protein [Anaerolineales bacterium HSG6]MDM8530808.1 hypothetical protein [Anaerolineales bacterium HSG25]